MPRITGSASRSQRSRSPGDSPNSIAEVTCLFVVPRRPDAQISTAIGDVVEGRGHLRGQSRIAEWISADHQPDAHVRRRLRPSGEGHVTLEEGTVSGADDRVQVIPRPEAIEAQAIGADSGVEQRLPIGVLRPAQGAEPDVGVHGTDELFISSERSPQLQATVATRRTAGEQPLRA